MESTSPSPNVRTRAVLWGGSERTREAWVARIRERLPEAWELEASGKIPLVSGVTRYRGEDSPLAILTALAGTQERVCLIRADAELPQLAAQRLARALDAFPQAGVACPLSNAEPERAPLPAGERIDRPSVDAVDRVAYLYSSATGYPSAAIDPLMSLWRADAVAGVPSALDWTGLGAWLKNRGRDPLACDHVYVQRRKAPLEGPRPASDPRDRPAPGFLERLRGALAAAYRPAVADLPPAGLDEQPVLLHVLHSWGGGVTQWVRDIAVAQRDRHHLFLLAWSNPGSRHHGQELRLYADLDDPPLGQWPLPDPIASTAAGDDFYRTVLSSIVERYGVSAVAVSSLIGHSLDALRTGLPTLVVWHDYYPAWPLLRVCFETTEGGFDEAALERALATDRGHRFTDKDAAEWFALRAAQLETLAGERVRCVAPSASVSRNLVRLDPLFETIEFKLIPHGLRPWTDSGPGYQAPVAGQRLRLLVPGRLSAGKGKSLLMELLPSIRQVGEVYLLGAGKDAEDFFGESGVHVVVDYERERLPALIGSLKPHLAVLLSTVSETYGYTLSEMRALGVPVLATEVGAFCERIENGRDGWLVPPQASAIAGLIERLARQPEELARVAAATRSDDTDLETMAARYSEAFPLARQAALRYRIEGPSPAGMQLAAAARAVFELERSEARLKVAERAQQRELERRAAWAQRLTERLDRRTAWAQSLKEDLDRALAEFTTLQAEFDERTRWAQRLDQQVSRRDERILQMQTQIEHLNVLAERLEIVVNSRSWRLTRPLRFAARQARAVAGALGFHSRRAVTLAQRTRHSLRIRGVAGTVERIQQEFRQSPAALTPVAVPAVSDAPKPVRFTRPARPHVSIVIPAYNHYPHTGACLHSIAGARVDSPFELIVVDDASSDDTAAELARCEGLTVERNETNQGFVKSCNRGAGAARGEFLVFLNNDTAVADGWLDRLLETFEQRPDAGLVGAKLVYPDGRLQEAGGIVFADASGWNYGRFADPDDPAYNFVREVDYCSGACIMIRTALFAELGGFDERFAPAYYEDTDLAFKVRAAGHRVYYQPAAAVTHFEGVSSGTDLSAGTKRFQAINQQKFRDKWAGELSAQPAPGTPIDVARRHRLPLSALIIDACTPTPDQDSGSLRMVNLMRLLADSGFHVRFLADNRAYVEGYTADLQRQGIEALYHPHVSLPQSYLAEHGRHIDLVIASRHYVARHYIEMVRKHCPDAPLVFDTVDLHYLRERRLAELEEDPALAEAARKTRAQELDVARRSDLTVVVSPLEQEVLADEAPELKVRVLSNIHRVHGCRRGFEERADLLFVGGFQHPPNVDAMIYFVTEVLPLVHAALPEIGLKIVGSRATPEIRRLAGEKVEVLGYVPDLEPYLDGCRLAIAPLRYGAGVKGKVNMSMSYGQPVVATTPAVEGMHAEPGVDVLIGDTPETFAESVIQAYGDQELWERLSAAALANVEQHFSFDAARRALDEILTEVGLRSQD